jgi:hypothetical protein
MRNAEKLFSSEVWAKIQIRLDDKRSSELVMPQIYLEQLREK